MNCVFCELIESGSVAQLARNDRAVAFAPFPSSELVPGRTLVAPITHSVGVLDVPADDLAAAMELVQRVAQAMEDALGATGVVVLNASGLDSGQSVAHLHFHVVPCWADDQATFWPADRSMHRVTGAPHLLLADALSKPR